jgi:hypothetical protein
MTMNKKILLTVFLSLTILTFGLVNIVHALDTASVAATVTVQNIAVALDGTDGAIAYGTMAVGTSKSTITLGDTERVVNSGNVPEKLRIMGANTTGCVWTLGTAIGVGNTYVHQFSTNGGSNFTSLTLAYQDLVASIGVGITQPVDFMIKIPSSSSCYTTSTAGVTILAEQL